MTAPMSRTGATDREVDWPLGTIATIEVIEGPCTAWPLVGRVPGGWQSGKHHYPDRAVSAVTVEPITALREFAEFVVSLDDDDPESPGRQARRTVTLTLLITRARAALLAEQPGGGR